MSKEAITRIAPVGEGLGEADFKTSKVKREANVDYFDELVKQRSVKTEVFEHQKAISERPSPMDEIRELNQKTTALARATPRELSRQADDVIAQIETLKTKLSTPDLELKSSMQTVLKNKLSHIDENLKAAMEKAGLEYVPPDQKTKTLMNPIERFLGLLTHSQEKLETLSGDIKIMADQPNGLSPADMLLIQIKVGQMMQGVELATASLNKALESIKTIMNIQV